MRLVPRLLVLLALLPGCDLLGQIEGLLSRPTQSEISATTVILEGETGCSDVRVRSVSTVGVEDGALEANDCIVAGAYTDFWLLKTSSTSDVALALQSSQFAPYLALFPVDLQSETALTNEGVVDRDTQGDGRVALTSRVTAGLYVVVVTSVFEAETGDYSLDVRRGG